MGRKNFGLPHMTGCWVFNLVFPHVLTLDSMIESIKTLNKKPKGIPIKLKKGPKNLKNDVRKQLIPILGKYLVFFISLPSQKIEIQVPCNPHPKL